MSTETMTADRYTAHLSAQGTGTPSAAQIKYAQDLVSEYNHPQPIHLQAFPSVLNNNDVSDMLYEAEPTLDYDKLNRYSTVGQMCDWCTALHQSLRAYVGSIDPDQVATLSATAVSQLIDDLKRGNIYQTALGLQFERTAGGLGGGFFSLLDPANAELRALVLDTARKHFEAHPIRERD